MSDPTSLLKRLSIDEPQQQSARPALHHDSETAQQVSNTWVGIRNAVVHFLRTTPLEGTSSHDGDESNPQVRKEYIKAFSQSVLMSRQLQSPSGIKNDLLIVLLLRDQQFEHNLKALVQLIIEALFPHCWGTPPPSNLSNRIQMLDSFHWKMQCWFMLRDALNSFLQPSQMIKMGIEQKSQVYRIMDHILCQHDVFSRILINVRTEHGQLLTDLRFSHQTWTSLTSADSRETIHAVQSFFYFLQLCGSEEADPKAAIANYVFQLQQTLSAWTTLFKIARREICRVQEDAYPAMLSAAMKLSQVGENWTETENFISLHAFANQNVVGLEVIQNKCVWDTIDFFETACYIKYPFHLQAGYGVSALLLQSNRQPFLRAILNSFQIVSEYGHFQDLLSELNRLWDADWVSMRGVFRVPLHPHDLLSAWKWIEMFNLSNPCLKVFESTLVKCFWDKLSVLHLPHDDGYISLKQLFQRIVTMRKRTQGNLGVSMDKDSFILQVMKALAIVSKSMLPPHKLRKFLNFVRNAILKNFLADKVDEGFAHAISEFFRLQGLSHNFIEEISTFSVTRTACAGNDKWSDQTLDPPEAETSALQRSWSNGNLQKRWMSVTEEDHFQPYIKHHTNDGSLHFGFPSKVIHLASLLAIESGTIDDECPLPLLRLPPELSLVQSYAASHYKSIYPFRKISHFNHLSTVEVSTCFFSQSSNQPISFTVNLYQACVLKFFEQYQTASLEQIFAQLIVDDITEEQREQEKFRIRQAVVSLSTERAPMVMWEEDGEGSERCFGLNENWSPSRLPKFVLLFDNAFISCLDEKAERRIRGSVDLGIMRILRYHGFGLTYSRKRIVAEVFAARVHSYITRLYIEKRIEHLIQSKMIVGNANFLRLQIRVN